MIPWELIDRAPVPGDGGELTLHQRGEEFSIRADGEELMNSRVHGSEEVLAELACDRISERRGASVLVGGLGLGFTTAAALRQLAHDARVIVAELVPAVVAWNRGTLAHLADFPLGDPRVTVHEGDVGRLLKTARREYDAILLDVDNGPEGFTRPGNDRLYSQAGLATARSALRRGGVLAVWSAAPNRAFSQRLTRGGFRVEEVTVGARRHGGGPRHTLWLAETTG